MIQAVIFDMDGTLIDSEPFQSHAFAEVIREYGKIPIPYENGLVQLQGLRGDETWKVLKERHDIQEDTAILRIKRRVIYERLLEKEVKIMRGLRNLLRFLKKKNIKMGIASSSPRNQIEFILKKFAIETYFDALIGGEDVTHGKPHPEPYLKAGKLLRIYPKHTIAIEDAKNGILSAKRAGMITVALHNPYCNKDDFLLADIICYSLTDIMKKVTF